MREVFAILSSVALLALLPAASFAQSSAQDWEWQTVDPDTRIGRSTSLAHIGGRLMIAYAEQPESESDSVEVNLKLAVNSELDGSGAWRFQTVDTEGRAGKSTSLAEIDGRPAISYYDLEEDDLKFAINSEPDGSGEWDIQRVDTEGDVGRSTTLTVVDGRPTIVYEDWTGSNFEEDHIETDLKFAINTESDGSGRWRTQTIEESASAGSSSLIVVNGRPAVSYYDRSGQKFMFAVNTEANGSGDWHAQTVDEGEGVGITSSVSVINGKLMIAYLDADNDDVKFAVNSEPDGSGEWTTRTVASEGYLCKNTLSGEVDGRPVVLTHDLINESVKLISSSSPDGMFEWAVSVLEDEVPGGGAQSSLLTTPEMIIVAYQDFSELKLRLGVARLE